MSPTRSALLRERDLSDAQVLPVPLEVDSESAAKGRCRDSASRDSAARLLRHRPPVRPALALRLRLQLLLCRWRENASASREPITDCSLGAPDADADAEAEEDCVELEMALALEAGGCVHVGFVRGKRRGRCFGVGAFALAFAFGGRATAD